MGLLASAFLLGIAFFLPTAKRLRTAVESAGLESGDAGQELGRYRTLTWIDAGLLIAAMFVMTVKPF